MDDAMHLLTENPYSPLTALWEVLKQYATYGPEVAISIVNDPRCGLECRTGPFEDFLTNASSFLSLRKGATPLLMATLAGRPDVVEALLSVGADHTSTDENGRTALHLAASFSSSNLKTLNLLLVQKGAQIDVGDRNGQTPLHIAAQGGCLSAMSALITLGADVRKLTNQKMTPLHLATRHAPALELLIAKGALVDAVDEYQRTPLFVAAGEGHTSGIKVLVAHGASLAIAASQGRLPLHHAVNYGRTSAVAVLLSLGAEPDAVDIFGDTPLLLAARTGRSSSAEMLVCKGSANISVKDPRGEGPLHLAAQRGQIDMVECFISQGADVNAQTVEGWTALHLAAIGGRSEVCELLLAAGAEVSARNFEGKTPLSQAKLYHDCCKLLQSEGATPEEMRVAVAPSVLIQAKKVMQPARRGRGRGRPHQK